MNNLLSLYILLFLIGSIFVGYLYICWNNSNYKTVSKYGFLLVHISLFYESIPKIFHPYIKEYLGLYGEYSIYRILENISGVKKILINLYIPQGETVTDTEIDILFLHESGVYIIESKDFSGWIYGNETNAHWMQVFGKYRKYQFYNPVLQNYSHRKSLEKIIPEHLKYIKTMVVFSNRSTLKNISCTHETIIQEKDLKKEVHKYQQIIFTLSDIEKIEQKLKPYSQHSQLQKQVYIQEIQHLENILYPLSPETHSVL